jgi:hypothetical protein
MPPDKQPVPLANVHPRWWALKLLEASTKRTQPERIKAIDAVTDEMVRAGLCRDRFELKEWRYGRLV